MKSCLLFIVLLASLSAARGEVIDPSFAQDADRVARSVAEERVKDGIAGITYAVFNRDGLLFSGATGSGESSGTQRLDPASSLFRIASVSKIVTAMAVAQLIQEGKFALDTPLLDLDVRFVRELKRSHTNDLARWRTLTIRHLLAHISGISKDLPDCNMWLDSSALEDGAYPSRREFMNGLRDVELIFDPGHIPAGMKYSNLGFNFLARIVERYNDEGLTFAAYVQHHIFSPLGMKHSLYDIPFWKRGALTTGYTPTGVNLPGQRNALPKVFFPKAYDGSIGIATTAEDLGRLGMELFRWMKTDAPGKTHLKGAITRTMLTPTSPYAPDLGWALGLTWAYLPGESGENPVWVGNAGTGYGERALLFVSPERNIGIAIQLNARDAFREKYAAIINAAMLSVHPAPLSPSTRSLLKQVRVFLRNTPPLNSDPIPTGEVTAELAPYVGDFHSNVVGTEPVGVSRQGRLLFMGFELETVDAAKGQFRVPPLADVYFSGEPVEFQRDAGGSVERIRIGLSQFFYRAH